MKRNNILCLSVALAMGCSTAAFAQDDASYSNGGAETTVVKQKSQAKRPTYPTKEVQGVVVDAVSKTPLSQVYRYRLSTTATMLP